MSRQREFERVCAHVAQRDPLLVEAIDDVDLTLLEWALSLSPWDRLRAASGSLTFLAGFHRDAPEER